ncbi:hypothetical protein, partial [Bradyrhizobium sp. Leo170]|uniref:hypothetical protein n=1 Tax=Bradyrhizobium sp. Leo170 TaxID=1571199 RepID=UPI001A929A94
ATGTRLSLRPPLNERVKRTQSSDAKRRENVDSHPPFESDVGWVERSETHHSRSLLPKLMGFAALYPSYGIAV